MTLADAVGIFLFLLALTIAIAVHEWGHYITARRFGMRVERFFIGFGPTMWSVRRGHTEYGVKWLPIGGFCKIAGMSPYEDDPNFLEQERRKPGEPPREPVPESEQFRFKPIWQRWVTLAAGSTAHFVTAFLLLYLITLVVGTPQITNQVARVIPEVTASGESEPCEGTGAGADTCAPTPAAEAGLQSGDEIIAVDGRELGPDDIVRDAMAGTAGREITITYVRDGTTSDVTLTPRPTGDGGDRGFLGVEQAVRTARANPVTGLGDSAADLVTITGLSLEGLRDLPQGLANRVEGPATGDGGGQGPIGIVGIAQIAGDAVEADEWIAFLFLVIQFNVIIGIINLLPLPPMDGGYIAFLAWEKVSGRPVDLRRVAPAMMVIVALLLTLTMGLVWLDITNPVDNPFQ